MKAPMCDEHPHFGKVISRPFPGWLECLAESGPSGLEGDEVARHRRHRVTRPFVARRGANVRGPRASTLRPGLHYSNESTPALTLRRAMLPTSQFWSLFLWLPTAESADS
jgi:hypothetical protein